MKEKADAIVLRGTVSERHMADALLTTPGDAAVVHRGVLRSLVIACPDCCGELLTVNLDSRAGPAWRLFRRNDRLSLYPSVWRATGCESHFIIWRSQIHWCNEYRPFTSTELDLDQVLAALPHQLTAYEELAQRLDAIPWEVLSACHQLVARGDAQRGRGHNAFSFRRMANAETEGPIE